MLRAASEVAAANGALAHLGERRLTSLDEDRATARNIREHFGTVRDACLRLENWNFASGKATLSADPTAAPGQFALVYPLPSDCIRVRSVNGAEADDWAVEAWDGTGAAPSVSILSTDIAAPTIFYTRLIEKVALWDALFLSVFEFHLAAKIAPLIGYDNDTADSMRANADKLIQTARRIDKREAARSAFNRTTSLVSVRRI